MAAPWVRGEGRHLDSVQGRGVRRRRQIGPSTLSVAFRGRRRMDRPRATFFCTWRGGNVTRWVADGTTSWMMAWFLDGDREFRHSEGGFWIGNGGADEDWAFLVWGIRLCRCRCRVARSRANQPAMPRGKWLAPPAGSDYCRSPSILHKTPARVGARQGDVEKVFSWCVCRCL